MATVPQEIPTVTELTTRSGYVLRIAPAGPADTERLRSFFRQVSPEDMRYRFLGTVNEIVSIPAGPAKSKFFSAATTPSMKTVSCTLCVPTGKVE